MYRELLTEKFNPSHINKAGSAFWHNQSGELHRDGDQPAVVHANGGMKWYKNGEYHRDGDRPAIISANGGMKWYKNGLLHRDNDRPTAMNILIPTMY